MNEAGPVSTSTEFDRFTPYYDLEFGAFAEDLPLYEQFAARAGARLLELGCGTGRLLVPLAQRGLRVTGVDISATMLNVARTKLQAVGPLEHARLVRDDIRTLTSLGEERFDLAFSAINSFLHLETLDDQRAALHAVAAHLRRGGLFIADLLAPDPVLLATYDGRLVHTATFHDPASGARIDKFSSSIVDYAEQRIETTFFYDTVTAGGALRRETAPFVLRYVGRFELELLLGAAGFNDISLYGSYELEPFTAESDRLLVVAAR